MFGELETLKNNVVKSEEEYDKLAEELEQEKLKKLQTLLDEINENQEKVSNYLKKISDYSVFSKSSILPIYIELFNIFEDTQVKYVPYDEVLYMIRCEFFKINNNYNIRNFICGINHFQLYHIEGYILPSNLTEKLENNNLSSLELRQLILLMSDRKNMVFNNYMRNLMKFYQLNNNDSEVEFMIDSYPDYFKEYINYVINYRLKNNIDQFENEAEMLKMLENEFLKSKKNEIKRIYSSKDKLEREQLKENVQRRKLILQNI